MGTYRTSIGRLLMVVAGVLTVGGCGSSADKATSAGGGVTVGSGEVVGTSVEDGSVVTVDVQAGEYYFKSPVTTFRVGVHYRFVVHNVGDIEHEFMLMQPVEPGMMSMAAMDATAMGHIEESGLRAHHSGSVDLTFPRPYPAGMLEMACHLEQHYQNGMHLPVTVTP